MKARNGFVSNSSSSSFIVTKCGHQTPILPDGMKFGGCDFRFEVINKDQAVESLKQMLGITDDEGDLKYFEPLKKKIEEVVTDGDKQILYVDVLYGMEEDLNNLKKADGVKVQVIWTFD